MKIYKLNKNIYITHNLYHSLLEPYTPQTSPTAKYEGYDIKYELKTKTIKERIEEVDYLFKVILHLPNDNLLYLYSIQDYRMKKNITNFNFIPFDFVLHLQNPVKIIRLYYIDINNIVFTPLDYNLNSFNFLNKISQMVLWEFFEPNLYFKFTYIKGNGYGVILNFK